MIARTLVTATAALLLTAALVAAPAASRPAAGPVLAVGSLGPAGTTTAGAGMASGRIQDLAVDPFDPTHLLALSDAALWGSHNSGTTWTALPGLHQYGQWKFEGASLTFDPTQSGTVLLSSPQDDQTATQRGVYRSTDGGQTWVKPTGYQPTCGSSLIETIAVHGASAAAAGACGVGISSDDGQTWAWSQPDTSGGFLGVAWDASGDAFTCGATGIFERLPSHPNLWLQVVDFSVSSFAAFGAPASACRVIASPDRSNHVFFAARWNNFQPDITNVPASEIFEAWGPAGGSGWHVRNLKGGHFENGRDVLIQTRPATGGFDLFWDNTDLTYFEHCTTSTGAECPIGATDHQDPPNAPWTKLGHGNPGLHADSTRILFDATPSHCITMVSGDGGIQVPANGDCNGTTTGWRYSDAGISAAEVYELALSQITTTGAPVTPDAYIATQDNGAFALLSGSSVWTQQDGGDDGAGIVSTPTVNQVALSSEKVYYSSDGNQLTGDRGLPALTANGEAPFVSPWAGVDSSNGPTPGQLTQLSSGLQVLGVLPRNNVSRAGLFTSTDGSTWTPISGSASTHLIGVVGGRGGVSLSANGTNVFVRVNELLYRVTNITASAAQHQLFTGTTVGPYAIGPGGRILALTCTSTSAGQCGTPSIIYSTDGGTSYVQEPVLARMLTTDENSNRYQLLAPTAHVVDGQLRAFAIDPANPNIMAAGTLDTGIFQTGDAGRSWQRIGAVAPFVTGLQFTQSGLLYFSTYGRGVFEYRPAPDVAALTQYFDGTQNIFTVGAATSTGKPVANATVIFRHIDGKTGTITTVGKTTTDTKGQAQLASAKITDGSLVADVYGSGVPTVETQTPVLGQ